MESIGYFLAFGMQIYSFAVIIYIFMSWFPGSRESQFGQMLGSIVEPFIEPFRKVIPPLGMIDISPIVALIALNFARYGVIALFT
ncbi:YggT family protein [Salsuginibacillus kocurii]|uniref:YggT family protein n=1 Tax=Salsuginibacillus kocurii TaxID=427078 RepID=UPI00036115A0|nr:YggT family protein [Salsuginibacillus kocurii]